MTWTGSETQPGDLDPNNPRAPIQDPCFQQTSLQVCPVLNSSDYKPMQLLNSLQKSNGRNDEMKLWKPHFLIVGLLMALPSSPASKSSNSTVVIQNCGTGAAVCTTATQAIVMYTVPPGEPACTIQVWPESGNPSRGSSAPIPGQPSQPLALDFDPTVFANANLDLSRPTTLTYNQGLARIVTIGQRTAQLATAGQYAGLRHFSRALQANTQYYGEITCPNTGASTTFTFATTNIPAGNTYGDPWLADASRPGQQPWPETLGGKDADSFVDPLTGVLLKRLGMRSTNYSQYSVTPWNNAAVFSTAYNQGYSPCDSGHAWSNPCGSIVSGQSGATSVANSQAPLVLRPPLAGGGPWQGGYGGNSYGQMWTLDQLAVNITGSASSNNSGFRVLDVCLSMNGGASCASTIRQMTLTQGASQQTVGHVNITSFGTTPWLLDTYPRINVQESSPNSGNGTVTGSTLTWTGGSNYWSLYWTQGGNGRIRISTANDACSWPTTKSVEYTITQFTDGLHMTVSPTPPSGPVYWCELNFAVIIWRDQAPTDGSTVTLTGANMSVIESYGDTYPDNGDGPGCFDRLVDGGYFCLYGGMYWIDPTSGAAVYYGYPSSYTGATGSLTTNAWKGIASVPGGEAADIDQTQDVLTAYSVSTDPAGGGPLIIQMTFNPSVIAQPSVPYPNGSQIGNAGVSGTTPYSVSYSNGLTFTNLTPQSLNRTIVEQMATFDPSFSPTLFSSGPNGWNCMTYGESLGVLYVACFSMGGDSPAWILAFSPGDGNPAHAGLPGGPSIIGAVNTFNTPNGPVSPTQTAITGRSLHAIVQTGETGWISMNTHANAPINTSNASVPASSQNCSQFGLTNAGQCILLSINSYTAGGVSGYEPYYASPQFQFRGAPGEMRTTQIGDTACVASSSAGNCVWYVPGNQELMTLVAKNYNGVNGAWLFERNAYGTEAAIPNAPITLWWQSIQWTLPPQNTVQTSAFTAYWNPTGGCGGAPDPHGNCLIQDSNETMGHGEWENGGEAVATNVPEWAEPIWGWPTDYQCIVGFVPGMLELPFANLTPDVASGVNYTSANPPFAGTYGHPWGFDTGSHSNAAGVYASPNEAVRAFDNSPVQAGQNEPIFAQLTGQLYVATPASVIDADDPFGYGGTPNGIVAINRKLMATAASCGSHPVTDISGPSSIIDGGSEDSFTYCVVRNGSECYPGSSVGQIYMNCPGVVSTGCTGSAIHGGTPFGVGSDMCVGNIGAAADAVRQFTLNQTDYYGAYTRTLVTATSWLRMVSGFENNRLLPDNSWLLFRMEFPEYQSQEMWMAKVPPFPALDSLNRGTFIPLVMKLNPPQLSGLSAVAKATVQFGYAEYGAPTQYNCTTRHDPCVATASTVSTGTNQPFQFLSEFSHSPAPTVQSCTYSAGCEIAIPAISQRVLYYNVVFNNAAGQTVATYASATTVP